MYNDNFITLWCYLKHKSCKYNLISNSIIQSGNSFHFSQPPLLCSFLLLDGTRQAIRDNETYARFFHHSFSTALPPMHMPYSHYRTPRIVAPCIRSNRCMLGFIFICTHIPVLPLMLVSEWREIKKKPKWREDAWHTPPDCRLRLDGTAGLIRCSRHRTDHFR